MSVAKTKPQIPVWTWRDAVRQSAVAPLTKLVCYSIANYLTDVGQGCWPSTRTLMADTGLSNRSVATHIAAAVEAGLLAVERKVGGDGRFQLTRYLPRFPDNAVLARAPADMRAAHDDAEAETEAEIPGEGASHGDADDESRVKEAHAARPSEAASPGEGSPREPDRVNLAQRELSTREYTTPLTPRTAGGTDLLDGSGSASPRPSPAAASKTGHTAELSRQRAAKQAEWLAELEAVADHQAVEVLFRPLLTTRHFAADKPTEALREAAKAAKGIAKPALAKAFELVTAGGRERVRADDLAAAIAKVRKHGAMVVIRPGSAQWQRWLAHFDATDKRQADVMRGQASWMVRAEWPPSSTAARAGTSQGAAA